MDEQQRQMGASQGQVLIDEEKNQDRIEQAGNAKVDLQAMKDLIASN